MTEPRTEAGKRLLDRIAPLSESGADAHRRAAIGRRDGFLVAIRAIEDEVAASVRTRIEALPNVGDSPWGEDVDHVERATVLAAASDGGTE